MVTAMRFRAEPEAKIVNEIYEWDFRYHQPRLFTDKNEGFSAKDEDEGGGLDFLDDAGDTQEAAVTKTYTIEEVRKALADLQTRVGTPRALALFKEVSGGAERLPQLSEDKYAEVFEAAEKMRK